jgi:ABC-type antimicrobial peptide transport system permease subunit
MSNLLVAARSGVSWAAAIGTLVASLVFEGRARDPLVIAGVVVLVGAVGLAACATAAKQVLRINPAAALRDE